MALTPDFSYACSGAVPTRTLDRVAALNSQVVNANNRLESVLGRIEGVINSKEERDTYGGSYIADLNELERQVDRLNNLVTSLEAHV